MPNCPLCGTEVSEGAGFCSKCLRRLMKGKAAKGKSKKKLAGIIVACVIAISAVIVVTMHLLTVPSGHVAELDYVGLSAYGFAQELFNPELTSLQRDNLWKNYEGKQAEWTNELKYVSTEEGLVAYFLNPLDWAQTEVVAVFDESQRSSLSNLKEGDLVTYTGVLTRFEGAEIILTDCTVVSLSIVPLWWNGNIDTHKKRILVGDEILCLGPSTYEDATEYRHGLPPQITAMDIETGDLLWEDEQTESILVGIDSHYVYAWHLAQLVPRSEPDPWYWFASNITALNKTSGQIGWVSSLSEDVNCIQQPDCLPDEWSRSDFVDCCVLGESVKEEIEEMTNEGEPGLTFLTGKPPLSELTYEYQGVIYKSVCAVYGSGTGCGALQALDQQTGDVLWMMTFREKGVKDFSIVDGILYVSTDEGVGAFQL
jgi:predicted nucleic acid-binding Zn ribbon protein